MPEVQEEDERGPIPFPLKSVVPAIPKRESKLQELIEDLRLTGCEGLVAKSRNLRVETTLGEFLFERGNQWIKTMKHDPSNWTAEVWARMYGLPRGKGEGWVGLWVVSM